MLNNRLGTQPLDPNILLQLEGKGVQKTQPLNASALPELTQPALLGDAFAKPASPNGGIPAQAGDVSNALKPMDLQPLSGPMAAPTLGSTSPGSTGGMTSAEATLLLDFSAKMGDMRYDSPVRFSEAVKALETLNNSPANGFSQLSGTQQAILMDLGITPENSQAMLQKLYQIILPESGATSSSYQNAQNSVSSFLSGLNVQEKAINFIENSKELSAVANLLDGLSANSITSLIVDKVQQVNDFAVGTITGQSLKITEPMDFTVGKVMMDSSNPQKMQGVASAFEKVKQQQQLTRDETILLGEYGLFVGENNKLKTMDSESPLSVESVSKLEKMVNAATSQEATPMFAQVMTESRKVLEVSEDFKAMSAKARRMTEQLVADTAVLDQQTQQLQVQRQQTNVLQADLDAETNNVKTLTDANAIVQAIAADTTPPPPSAYGTFSPMGAPPAAPKPQVQFNRGDLEVLKAAGIEVRQTSQGTAFFAQGREIAPENLKTHVLNSLLNSKARVEDKRQALVVSQQQTNTTAAKVDAQQTKVQQQQAELKAVEAELDALQQQLKEQLEAQAKALEAARPYLSANELAVIEDVVNPALQRSVADSLMYGAETRVMMDAAQKQANRAIEAAQREQKALAQDQQRWNATLTQSESVLKQLADQIQELKMDSAPVNKASTYQREPAVSAQPVRRSRYNPLKPAKTGTAPLNPAWLESSNAEFAQRQKDRREVQDRNELTHFEHLQSEKRFNDQIQESRRELADKKAEKERMEVQAEERSN